MGFLKEILFEAISNDYGQYIEKINTALDKHYALKINYRSQEESRIAPGERIIYPITYGISTRDYPSIRAYQDKGATSSHQGWKLFHLDGITDMELTNEVFTLRDLPNFEFKNDDEQMKEVIKMAFSSRNPDNTIDATSVTKKEISKPGELQKTTNQEPIQNINVQNAASLDNSVQNTDIPSGIAPQTQLAPDNKPITKATFQNPNEPEEPQTTNSTKQQEALPNEPITRKDLGAVEKATDELTDQLDSDEDGEDKTEEFQNDVTNLMERINKLYRRK